MATIKVNENLFLGKPEIQSLINFLDEKGFREFLRRETVQFGVVRNQYLDPTFLNCKIEAGVNTGDIKINSIKAVDKNGNLISADSEREISVPANSQWYWVRIKHIFNPTEKGKVSIDASGNLIGIGTEFTKKLRQKPNFPSKIKFKNSSLNTLEYEVQEIIDDENVILKGFFDPESDLTYSVVGTFTPGSNPSSLEKEPFQYDSCEITLVEEISANTAPTLILDEEFYLARVRNVGGTLNIQDKREKVWKTKADLDQTYLPSPINKFAGVEAVKWNSPFSDRTENIIEIAWGLRSTNWSVSDSLRQITIANGQGGAIKRDNIIDTFVNGDFNGWRCYFNSSGEYSKVVESVIDAGAIKITLDYLNPDNYTLQDQILIVPDVEEVTIRIRSNVGENTLVENNHHFPVNTPLAKISVLVPSESSYLYNIRYRYRNNHRYSNFRAFEDSWFYAESSFTSQGILNPNPALWVIKNYTKNENIGYIEVIANPNSFSFVIDRIDTGNKLGVRNRNLNNASPLINLVSGTDEVNQYFNEGGIFNLTTDHVINLPTDGRKDGNEFLLWFFGPFTGWPFTIQIRQDYIDIGTPGVLKYSFNEGDLASGNAIFYAVFQSGNWDLKVVRSGGIALSQIPVLPTSKIADGAITTPKLADSAVTTVKIANSSVTNIKLADGSVTESKIADSSIGQEKWKNNIIATQFFRIPSLSTDRQQQVLRIICAGRVIQAGGVTTAVGFWGKNLASTSFNVSKIGTGNYQVSYQSTPLNEWSGGVSVVATPENELVSNDTRIMTYDVTPTSFRCVIRGGSNNPVDSGFNFIVFCVG